jgi:Cd2+/Zn2+-exporting ATPase
MKWLIELKKNENLKFVLRIVFGAIIYSIGLIFDFQNFYITLSIFVIAYIILGGDIVLRAVKNIFKGEVFDENFLMSIATIGAFVIGEYSEAVAVVLFFQIGELFGWLATEKSRKSISSLMNIRPEFANVIRGNEVVTLNPNEVKIGDIIIIKAGEKIPLDGKIIEGNSSIDTSMLTGETIPREVSPSNEVLAGCININGLLKVEVTKEFGQSTVSKILELVENASSKKANSEKFISKFARTYTPVVAIIALFIATVPPIIFTGETFETWVYRAFVFLVVSCPCALVISVPLGFFAGIGGASKFGVLVKGGNYLETLAKTQTFVFDKTGTLTQGVFEISEINAVGISKDDLLMLSAYAEHYSNHPISVSICNAYKDEIDTSRISDVEEISGFGVKAKVDEKEILIGNSKLMKKMEIDFEILENSQSCVYVAIDGGFAGHISVSDTIKKDAKTAIDGLKKLGISQIKMLTGDLKSVAEKLATKLGINHYYAELLPQDKVEKLEEIMSEQPKNSRVAFVGDGVNDAPVLARADVGIAMGGLGSDAAIEAADIVIMTDEPSRIIDAIKISRKTLRVVKQNIVFAIGTKVFVLILGAFGIATMWEAVFADVGVTLIAILNAVRIIKK